MTWHHDNKSGDGLVHHTADSKAWGVITYHWPNFSEEHQNVRLGLALDGIDPFGDRSSTWSTWPVLLLNYNLPPWLTTKKFFVMLTLLILEKESVRNENIDIYMEPLMEELEELWIGVQAHDVSKSLADRAFNICAMLIWTIHDFPALGVNCRSNCKGICSLSSMWTRSDISLLT